MKNSKKSKLTSLIVLLIVAVIIIALAGTYAKYITSISGTATATVAKWDIDFKKDGTSEISKDFKIDVATAGTHNGIVDEKIQPGSNGSFTIVVENNSDTPANIKAEMTDESSSIFNAKQFTLTMADGNETQVAAKTKKTVTFNWNWNYETAGADANDTALGEAQQNNQKSQTICSIKLVATQVEPSTNN